MKRVIRSNCFETNSSSVHAIVVNTKAELELPKNNELVFGLKEYGWEVERYSDISNRAAYLWTAVCCNDNVIDKDDFHDYIKGTIKNRYPELDIAFADPENFEYINDYDIDHGDHLQDWLEQLRSDPEGLLQYLFGKDSIVYTANDNGDYEELPSEGSFSDDYTFYKKYN